MAKVKAPLYDIGSNIGLTIANHEVLPKDNKNQQDL